MKQPRPLIQIQRDIDAVKERVHYQQSNLLKSRLNMLLKERQDAELWISKTISEL